MQARRTTPVASLSLIGALAFASACSGQLNPTGSPDVTGADAGVAQPLSYRSIIQDDLETFGCTQAADCHGQAAVPMTVMPGPSTEDAWRTNFDEVKARAGNSTSSMLLTKPTGLGGHPNLLPPSSPVLRRWTDWIERGTPYDVP